MAIGDSASLIAAVWRQHGLGVANPGFRAIYWPTELSAIFEINTTGDTMEIQSKLLGNQEVNPDTIITFPRGLPGFEDQKRFKLFHQDGSEIVYWLQSVDDEGLLFSVAHPLNFNINYSFVLTDEEEALLQVTNSEELLILIVLHKDDEGGTGKPTIKGSIKSPLVINTEKRIGLQKILVTIEQSITLTEKVSEIDVAEA